MKHTKGKWYASDNGHYIEVKLKGTGHILASTQVNKFIGIDYEVMKANAKLIAAAPDLLRALIMCVNGMQMADEVEFLDKIMKATKAINKATK